VKGNNKGSRGTRLNERVLCDVFRWAHVGYEAKSLKVIHKSTHQMGLYLRLSQDKGIGRVRIGADGLETKFDVFPAYAPTSAVPNSPLYVFRFRHPPGWQTRPDERWVLWDMVKQRVALTRNLQDFCFVRIVKERKRPNVFRVVLAIKETLMETLMEETLVELRMQARRIKPIDIKLGIRETSEISFEKYLKGKHLEVGRALHVIGVR
jgi:hypothetical protein